MYHGIPKTVTISSTNRARRAYNFVDTNLDTTDTRTPRLESPGLPWERNFYPHTHPIPTENPVGIIPHRIPLPTEPQNPTYPYPHPVFSLQEAYFNLLFVTLTVGYYMMYVLCESVCD